MYIQISLSKKHETKHKNRRIIEKGIANLWVDLNNRNPQKMKKSGSTSPQWLWEEKNSSC